jgi:hypothetical protein
MKNGYEWNERLSLILLNTVFFVVVATSIGWAQSSGKAERTFSAILTDSQGIESEVKNIVFYWEEKVSETAFVPHEWREVPVKKGTATIKVKFDQIKQIDLKRSAETAPIVSIALENGKTGEFALAINGKFKGMSDFGEAEFPADTLSKIIFKPTHQ